MGEVTNLNIATGLREFNLNGKVTVTFNPTDYAFAEKLYRAYADLDSKQGEISKKLEEANIDETFDLMRQMDGEMRKVLNDLFGKDVVTPLIGSANIYAFADGVPIWCNLLFAVLDLMDVETTEQQKKTRARMAKYTAKYEAQDHKKKNR